MPNIYWLPRMRPKNSLQNLKMYKMASGQNECSCWTVESRVASEASVSSCLSCSLDLSTEAGLSFPAWEKHGGLNSGGVVLQTDILVRAREISVMTILCQMGCFCLVSDGEDKDVVSVHLKIHPARKIIIYSFCANFLMMSWCLD